LFAPGEPSLEPHLESAVGRAAQSRETKHLGILLVPEIFDSAKNAEVRIHFVLRHKVHNRVILDVEVWSAEV
jgi:hypothetical protein